MKQIAKLLSALLIWGVGMPACAQRIPTKIKHKAPIINKAGKGPKIPLQPKRTQPRISVSSAASARVLPTGTLESSVSKKVAEVISKKPYVLPQTTSMQLPATSIMVSSIQQQTASEPIDAHTVTAQQLWNKKIGSKTQYATLHAFQQDLFAFFKWQAQQKKPQIQPIRRVHDNITGLTYDVYPMPIKGVKILRETHTYPDEFVCLVPVDIRWDAKIIRMEFPELLDNTLLYSTLSTKRGLTQQKPEEPLADLDLEPFGALSPRALADQWVAQFIPTSASLDAIAKDFLIEQWSNEKNSTAQQPDTAALLAHFKEEWGWTSDVLPTTATQLWEAVGGKYAYESWSDRMNTDLTHFFTYQASMLQQPLRPIARVQYAIDGNIYDVYPLPVESLKILYPKKTVAVEGQVCLVRVNKTEKAAPQVRLEFEMDLANKLLYRNLPQ